MDRSGSRHPPWPLAAIPELRRRAVGAYLGLAVGDALGATVEFMTPGEIREQYGTHRQILGGGWLRLRRGQVTDDTEMSLALGEVYLRHNAFPPGAVAEAFSEWMRGKPVDIGHTVRRGIIRFRTEGLGEVPENEMDAGNGAAMRCLPVALGLLGAPLSEVHAASRAQAHTTHHNSLSDAGTECVVELVQGGIQGAGLPWMAERVARLTAGHPEFRYDRRPTRNPSGYIVETLRVVFQALFSTSTFEEALVEAVNRGGDADTTGAILGMIAGALHGAEGIPRRWRHALLPEVRHTCETQALRLLTASPLGRSVP
jgi:ADP-ribosyl-[dinitrogen reductase] hydrolase